MKKIISLFAAVLFAGSMMAESHPYTFSIDSATIAKIGSGNSYSDWDGDHEFTATATDESGKTMKVVVTTSNVMVQKNNGVKKVQFKTNSGVLYNKTNLGTISSVTWEAVGEEAANLTKVIGSSENPSSAVANGAYFKVSGGASTPKAKSITVTFSKDDAVVPVSGIALDITSKYIEVGESFQLTATISPDDATNKNVKWSTASTKASVDENGVVTGLAVGSATIWAKSEADNTITASCDVTIGAAVPSEYVETAFNEIKSEDEVVITMKIDSLANNAIFALNGSDATGSAPKADKVRLVETSVKPVVEGNIFLASKVSGGYQFALKSDPTKLLYVFASSDDSQNNDIRVTSTFSGSYSTTWDIDEHGHLFATPKETARYLCVYNSADFRSYKTGSGGYSGNVYDGAKNVQTVKFYVKAIGGTPVVPTAIDETEAAGKATKELRNGQVLIIKGNKTYNILGQEIR